MECDVLVVGYGSELRGDDAAGRHVADAVATRDLPGVRVLSVPQLLPEIATDLAGCRAVVFVDASRHQPAVTVRRLTPRPSEWRTTHHASPTGLLALADALGPAPADALLVTVPAAEFPLGTTLSETTARAVPQAVEQVIELCRTLRAGTATAESGDNMTARVEGPSSTTGGAIGL